MPIGTFINSLAVILGSLVGVLLHRSLPERIRGIVFQGIGLVVLVIGIQMALNVENLLLLVFSILIGGVVGEAADLERRLEEAGEFLKSGVNSRNEFFTHGFVTASLIFCIGSMAVIGSIDEGIRGDRSLLLTKAIIDGFTAIALASTYGIGVLFSFVPLLLYQGGLTLLAGQAQAFFSESLLSQLTATGGVLIMGLGFNFLEIKRIRVTNLLPCLLVAVLLAVVVG